MARDIKATPRLGIDRLMQPIVLGVSAEAIALTPNPENLLRANTNEETDASQPIENEPVGTEPLQETRGEESPSGSPAKETLPEGLQ
ncbi:hypothetical protein [Dongia sp.]|uniref:hypothetical protein n=1 Tax=Dongia sp. TaxID=1977262 RepID=UPI0035B2D69E